MEVTAEGGAVDAGVGADLDIVADFDAADLRKFFVMIAGADEAEAVRAKDASGMQNGAVADGHMAVNGDVGMEKQSSPMLTSGPMEQPGPMLERSPMGVAVADGDVGSDGRRCWDLRAGLRQLPWGECRRLRDAGG